MHVCRPSREVGVSNPARQAVQTTSQHRKVLLYIMAHGCFTLLIYPIRIWMNSLTPAACQLPCPNMYPSQHAKPTGCVPCRVWLTNIYFVGVKGLLTIVRCTRIHRDRDAWPWRMQTRQQYAGTRAMAVPMRSGGLMAIAPPC